MKKIIMMFMLLAPMTMFAQKIGCVDIDAVAQNLSEFTKAQEDLQALAKQKDTELEELFNEYKRKAEDYDKNKSTMNATKQQETEQTLIELQQKIQQARQDAEQELAKQQQEKLAPIQSKVNKAIENVGNNGKYSIIVLKGTLPFISSTLVTDVTSECKTEVLKLK